MKVELKITNDAGRESRFVFEPKSELLNVQHLNDAITKTVNDYFGQVESQCTDSGQCSDNNQVIFRPSIN